MSLTGRNPHFPRVPGKPARPAAKKAIPEPRTPAKKLTGKPAKALRPKVVKTSTPIVLWAVVVDRKVLRDRNLHLRVYAKRSTARISAKQTSATARVVKLVEG